MEQVCIQEYTDGSHRKHILKNRNRYDTKHWMQIEAWYGFKWEHWLQKHFPSVYLMLGNVPVFKHNGEK